MSTNYWELRELPGGYWTIAVSGEPMDLVSRTWASFEEAHSVAASRMRPHDRLTVHNRRGGLQ